ncbi:hypothetical protein SAMN05720354_110116 [Nitrosospira sp. Nsp1]|nr:hypothetical protein SAMN05720354_110116 [Nitrosospira sp. Nsp1]
MIDKEGLDKQYRMVDLTIDSALLYNKCQMLS